MEMVDTAAPGRGSSCSTAGASCLGGFHAGNCHDSKETREARVWLWLGLIGGSGGYRALAEGRVESWGDAVGLEGCRQGLG